MNERWTHELAREATSYLDALARTQVAAEVLSANIRVEPYDADHGSGAILFKASGPNPLFIKYHPTNTPKELLGFKLLSQWDEYARHLIPPLVEDSHTKFWVSPFVESRSLHELACTNVRDSRMEEFSRTVFRHFLQSEASLWHNTQRPIQADIRKLYRKRVSSTERITALGDIVEHQLAISRFLDMVIVVNSKTYGTLRDVIGRFYRRLEKLTAPLGCIVHGDDQPRNIIIPYQSIGTNPRDWFIVDYVTAHDGGDWMIGAAKMFHWWDFYCTIDMALYDETMMKLIKPVLRANRRENRIEISYSNEYLEQIRPVVARGMRYDLAKFLVNASGSLELDPHSWDERFRLALFAVVFGSAYRHSGPLASALPLMIGKSLEYLEGENHHFMLGTCGD